MKAYLVKGDSSIYPRIVFYYSGKGWIFFENATIINVNGDRISWNIKSYEKDNDVGSGGYVSERSDILITPKDAESLIKLLSGGASRLRLSGKRSMEYEINEKHRNVLIEILSYRK